MSKRPKQADVARLAGVSRATVSYVLNERTNMRIPITEQTRQKVLKAAENLGYEPSALARSLKSGESRTIGLLMPDVHNPHYWDILEGAEEVITAQDYHLMLVTANLDLERERQCLRALTQQRLDGVIMMPTFTDVLVEETAQLAERSTPAVFVTPVEKAADWVLHDVHSGAVAMMDHLLSLGHTRIGFINGTARPHLSRNRADVYNAQLQAAGLPLDQDLIRQCGHTMEAAYHATHSLLNLDNPPTAIWAINDLLAIGALRAIRERRLRVPDDVALAGFDDIAFAQQLYPPLTTVHMPSRQLGRRAAEFLFQRIADPEAAPKQALLPTHLVVRESTVKTKEAPIEFNK